MQMNRFEYVPFDLIAIKKHARGKLASQDFEAALADLPNGREKSLALTKIEEAFMWFGKAVREELTARVKIEAGEVPALAEDE